MKRLGSIAIAVVMGAIVSGLGSGSAIATICEAVPGNLVSNCGFETGDFTSWTQSGNTVFDGVSGGTRANSGSFGAFFGAVSSLGFITQNLSTTVGGTYDLAFFLEADAGTPNRFQASWDGAIISALTINNTPGFPYTLFTFAGLTASTASTPLQFGFRHDPSFFAFDDVSVVGLAGPSTVPGPSSLLLIGSGLAGLAIWWPRRS